MAFENYYLGSIIYNDQMHDYEQDRDDYWVGQQQIIIPRIIALALCANIQEEEQRFLGRLRCWRCRHQGQDGIPARLIASRPCYCGCDRVNRRYLERG